MIHDSNFKAIHVATDELMVTGDVVLEGFLVQMFHNVSIIQRLKTNQPMWAPPPTQTVFTL